MFVEPPSPLWVVEIEKAASTSPYPLHLCWGGDSRKGIVKYFEGSRVKIPYPQHPTAPFFNSLLTGRRFPVHLSRAPDDMFRHKAQLLVLPSSLSPDEYYQRVLAF